MNDKILEKRKKLAKISDLALKLEEIDSLAELDCTVNSLIMKHIYNPKNQLEFNSFFEWKKQGFNVKKGEKAFLLWGKPVRKEIKEGAEDEQTKKYKFFPLAYVFSNRQVEKPE